jgi:hypothetical protein
MSACVAATCHGTGMGLLSDIRPRPCRPLRSPDAWAPFLLLQCTPLWGRWRSRTCWWGHAAPRTASWPAASRVRPAGGGLAAAGASRRDGLHTWAPLLEGAAPCARGCLRGRYAWL